MAKRAAIYIRVSTDEQARNGYSLQGQRDELIDACEQLGYEIVDEYVDKGYSRSTLDRPDLERLREDVADGKIDVVLAWQRDRYGASPYPLILAEEFAAHDCKLKALDDTGEGDDAEFLGEIKDAVAK